jgi:competence protein ComEC
MKYWLLAPIHTSWLIAIGCTAVFSGVVLARYVPIGAFASIAWLLTGSALALWACLRQQRWVVLLVMVGGSLIGLWRGTLVHTALESYEPLIGKTLTVSGVVDDDADIDRRGNTVVRLKGLLIDGHEVEGSAWVAFDGKLPIKRSDHITFSGKLNEGFGTFVFAVYQAKIKGVKRPVPGDIALSVRDWFAELVRRGIPEPEASLGIGFLVGQQRSLPAELDMALKIAGLTHIVVASGYNLTILVRLARRLFVRISKYMAALTSGGLIVSFIAITGMSPSMSRAGLVSGLSLIAWYYGRKFHPLVLLPFAVAVTVMLNPSYAWGDVGWQLSFLAFGGVMVLAPLLQAYYFGAKKPGTLRQILGETIAATIMTLPILIYYFGSVSNVGILANLLVLPLVPLAMLLTFIAGIGAVVTPAISELLGVPAYLILYYMTHTAQGFAGLPWALSELTIQSWQVGLMYATITSFMIYMWRKTKLNLRDANLVE